MADGCPVVLLAGPCAMESRDHAREVAEVLVAVCGRAGVPLIYKSSFDKANRTSVTAGRGIGMTAGLEILAEVRERFGCPVLTDVHEPSQCAAAAEHVDVLQIPAFLCRTHNLQIGRRACRARGVQDGS